MTIRPPVRAWRMLSIPSRSAVPGATISRALTSRGSWRPSSSVSSSPERCAIKADSSSVFSRELRDVNAVSSARGGARWPLAQARARMACAQRAARSAGETTVRSPNLAASGRGGRGGRPCAARRSARPRRSRPAATGRWPMPRAALATASATARSAPGSSTRTPPTTLTNTSLVPSADARVAAEHGEHEREPVAVDPVAHPPRRHELATARRAPGPRRAAAASPPSPRARRCPGARVASPTKRALASRTSTRPPSRISKTPDLVGRAEAVLQRAQRAVGALALALELQHAVDEVLEHPRAGQRALLGHVADEQHGDALRAWPPR